MPIGRREFLAGLGGFGIGVGLGGVSHWLPLAPPEIGADWSPDREKFISSTCTLCPAHCGIRGRVVDGMLVRVDGNPLHPVSRGGLCPKGLAGIQLLYHPGRLTGPVERVGPAGAGEFRTLSWEEGIQRVANVLSKLRAEGEADTLGWLAGDVSGIMEDLLRRFCGLYGTPNFLHETYADGSADVVELSQGIHAPPAFDLSSSDLVVSFGAALSEAWWCLPQAARARGAEEGSRPRWVQVDVRHSRTAARADEWVPVRPGTYGALALGIAYVLLKEGLYDAEKIHRHVDGIEDWTDEQGRVVPGFRTLVLRHGRTEEIARRTGVSEETLIRLAKAFGTASRPVALWDQALSWRSGGLADALAVHALNILTGALNRPGGVLLQPPLPVPSLAGSLSAKPGTSAASTGALSVADWAERTATGTPAPLKALFMYYANPVGSAPNPAEVVKALERIPFVVSFSPFLDESAKHADLVLPDHTYLERWQDAPAPSSVPIPVWGVVQPMVPPLHDTRATGDVILDLAAKLGGDVAAGFPWPSVEAIVRQRSEALAGARRGSLMAGAFRRDELRELEARGWWIPHGLSKEEFWTTVRESGGWFDPYYDYHDWSTASQLPGAKVRVFSLEARRLIAASNPSLEEGFLPLDKTQESQSHDESYPLLLMPYRVMTLASGSTALMPWLLEHLGILTGDAWETWAEINPETGRELGLSPGHQVRIESEVGAFLARLRFYAGAQPGVINVPYGLHTVVEGWGQAQGANPLQAVGARRDPATGMPDWYSTRVRVVAV